MKTLNELHRDSTLPPTPKGVGEDLKKVIAISMLGLTLMGRYNYTVQNQLYNMQKEYSHTIDDLKNNQQQLHSLLSNTQKELILKQDEISHNKHVIKELKNDLSDKQEQIDKYKRLVLKKQSSTRGVRRTSGNTVVHVNDRGIKSYMDYRTITNKSSKQYKLQQQAKTNNGYRMLNGRFMIALGSRFGNVGDIGELQLHNGVIIPYVIGDQKADKHTDSTNTYHLTDNSVVEFIVDTRSMSNMARRMGDMSYCTHNNFNSKVKFIRY